jgi:hypothetical protein
MYIQRMVGLREGFYGRKDPWVPTTRSLPYGLISIFSRGNG